MSQPQAIFPETREITPCTFNTCAQGHKWKPIIALVACQGCGGPVLMVKQANCPVCNEPVEGFVLRTDHITPGSGVPRLCCGEKARGESSVVELTRVHWKEVEAA
jgi:hypothetical protein